MKCSALSISITNNLLLSVICTFVCTSLVQPKLNACFSGLFPVYVIVAPLGFKKCIFVFFLYTGDADGELIARLCGQAAPSVPLVIAAPQIWVHFLSDENREDKGFLAHYTFEGKWLDRLWPLLTEALPGNVAIHKVILRIHTICSTLKEFLKSYIVSAPMYIHLK